MPSAPSFHRKTIHLAITISFLVTITTLLVVTREASAHAELDHSSPAADAILSAPPQKIELWFTEDVASGGGSPAVTVLNQDGTSLAVSEQAVDPSDHHHVSANVSGVSFGIYTVNWSTRSDDDGHSLSGTFGFRVGGTSRAPGAATVEGESPRIWAVATRWLTFLGAGIAAAAFLATLFVFGVEEPAPARSRRFLLSALAGAIGLLATLAEPLLQTWLPPDGYTSGSIADAFHSQPSAWWLRAPGLAVAIILAVVLARYSRLKSPIALLWAGSAAGLVAILGLALTSHASARDSYKLVATLAVVLHQWSVALWTGGLVQVVFGRALGGDQQHVKSPIRRFSSLALPLVGVGLAMGAVNAGFILPKLSSLWQSDYGKVLLVKIAILTPALLLATYHRLLLRRALRRTVTAFQLSLRLETVLVAMVVVGGSTLALLAPPLIAKGDAVSVDLVAPLPNPDGSDSGQFVRFRIGPAKSGSNDLGVAVYQGMPKDYNDQGEFVEYPPLASGVALARVSLSQIQAGTAPMDVDLDGDSTGWFTHGGVQIGLDGWWRAEVLIRRLGVNDVTQQFFFMLPDPNVSGFDAPDQSGSSPDGEALYQTGRDAIASLQSIHFVERLCGGEGTLSMSDHITHVDSTAGPATLRIASPSFEMIRQGGYEWSRETGGEWSKIDSNPVVPPSEWVLDYDGATSFKVGADTQINGRAAHLVTFYVPPSDLVPAWYAWWIDAETGNVLQEAMVSRGHYMYRAYDAFNSAPIVTPPTP